MRIAHFGTFDVENYGDLLFPLLLERALPQAQIIHVSPVGGRTPFVDALPTISVRHSRHQRFDAVVLGGGNLVNSSSRVVSEYRQIAFSAYPSLWAGAAATAQRLGVPFVVNSPSVGNLRGLSRLCRATFDSASYISVRDQASAAALRATGVGAPIEVVADSAFEVSELWPAASLVEEFHRSVGGDRTCFAVHVNRRYVGDARATAGVIDRASHSLCARPVLLAIGRCHGDDETARQVANHMRSRPIVIAGPTSLRQIAAIIAHSVAYAGSSMHGFITAAAHGRPGLLVAGEQPLAKFEGMLAQLGGSHRLLANWQDVPEHDGLLAVAQDPAPLQASVAAHWHPLRAALTEVRQPSSHERTLRHWRTQAEVVGRVRRVRQATRFAR